MSLFQEKIKQGKKVITTEVTPPRGPGINKFVKTAKNISSYVDALNITDNQRGMMRMSPIAASAMLIKEGLEPVCQIACRDKNRLALQSDLLGASALGIQNILALTGDPVQGGDNPDAKKVFEFECTKLLKMLSQFNNGTSWNERKLNKKTNFFLGATVNPTSPNQDTQLKRFEKKIENGARFFQTQAVFDIKQLESFIRKVEHFKIPIIVGVIMMKSIGTAEFLNDRVLGIKVPEEFMTKLKNSKNPEETGVEIAANQVKEFLKICDGVHVMAVRREHRIPDILEQAGIS